MLLAKSSNRTRTTIDPPLHPPTPSHPAAVPVTHALREDEDGEVDWAWYCFGPLLEAAPIHQHLLVRSATTFGAIHATTGAVLWRQHFSEGNALVHFPSTHGDDRDRDAQVVTLTTQSSTPVSSPSSSSSSISESASVSSRVRSYDAERGTLAWEAVMACPDTDSADDTQPHVLFV